jgi:hypothetical protein
MHQGPRAKLLSLGNFQKPARYKSPDCPVYTGQCPVLQWDAALELASLGILRRLLRYNSPDMSGVHRTVRCILGATAISAPTATCDALNARAARADVRHAHTGTPDIQQYIPVCTGHPGGPRSQKLQRSESNGIGDMAGAPDMSGVHRTVRCAIEQTASTNGQVWWLGL